jgi:hypothetical protein
MKDEEEEDFFREADLEQAIPLSGREDRGLRFDLEENSQASNYGKLERALFGFGSEEVAMEEEE